MTTPAQDAIDATWRPEVKALRERLAQAERERDEARDERDAWKESAVADAYHCRDLTVALGAQPGWRPSLVMPLAHLTQWRKLPATP